ncbi:MAG: hypothetical protein AAF586_02870 [Planctomycetota bacterium]
MVNGEPDDPDSDLPRYIDVRDEAMSLARSVMYERQSQQTHDELTRLMLDRPELYAGIQSVPYRLSEGIDEWIFGDHYEICQFTLFAPTLDGLFAWLLNTYRAGYMPVGWVEEPGGGRLLVLPPSLLGNEPETESVPIDLT